MYEHGKESKRRTTAQRRKRWRHRQRRRQEHRRLHEGRHRRRQGRRTRRREGTHGMSGRAGAPLELAVDAMADDYASGLTTREIGERYGCSLHTVQRRFHAAGVPLREAGPKRGQIGFASRGRPSAISRDGKQAFIHRACWEALHGPIPAGYHIHHADGNTMNNAPENLVCLACSEHAALHWEEWRQRKKG